MNPIKFLDRLLASRTPSAPPPPAGLDHARFLVECQVQSLLPRAWQSADEWTQVLSEAINQSGAGQAEPVRLQLNARTTDRFPHERGFLTNGVMIIPVVRIKGEPDGYIGLSGDTTPRSIARDTANYYQQELLPGPIEVIPAKPAAPQTPAHREYVAQALQLLRPRLAQVLDQSTRPASAQSPRPRL